jgi:hypothetical protein
MDDSELHSESDNEIEQKEQARAREDKSRWYVLRLGEIPQVRPEGVLHLLGGNLNSASSKEVRDRKISITHCLIKTWDVQGGGFSEIGIDWRKLPQSKGLASWFRISHDEYWTATAHNTNKNDPNQAARRDWPICRKRITAVHCKELRGLQGLREVALMDCSSQSMSQDKASGSLPGWQVETNGAVHNLPTAHQVHAN